MITDKRWIQTVKFVGLGLLVGSAFHVPVWIAAAIYTSGVILSIYHTKDDGEVSE